MNTYKIFIDNQEYTNATIPFSYGEFLDKELDHATIELTRIPKEHFNPTTPVRIEITSKSVGKDGTEYTQEKTLDYIISKDIYQEKPVGSGLYKHNLTLIEPTKLLEGIPVETLCFTNPGNPTFTGLPFRLFQLYSSGATVSLESFKELQELFFTYGFKAPMQKGQTLTFPTAEEILTKYYNKFESTEIPSYISLVEYALYNNDANNDNEDETAVKGELLDFTTDLNGVFSYKVDETNKIFLEISTNSTNPNYKSVKLQIVFLPFMGQATLKKYPLVPWTIKSVIERVLDLEKPLIYDGQEYVKNRHFKLEENPNIDFNALAPEFTFTRMSLREVLQMIGSYIHAEPRLKRGETGEFDTIAFDTLNTGERATYFNTYEKIYKDLSTYPYEDYSGTYGIEQACTALDSYMQNLVSRLNGENSSIGQPYDGGFQSLRTETSSVRFTDSGEVFFPTSYPIQQIHSFKVILPSKEVFDITNCLYEKKVYDSQLSSYSYVYGASKSYALYYNQNNVGIYGFWYKNEDLHDNLLEGNKGTVNFAITNIILTHSGLTHIVSTMDNILNLGFEFIYTPIYSARISHSKSYIGDWLNYPRILNYSQGANSVEIEYFGENIKGAVERLGTLEKTYTFTCYNLETIPKPGQMWDSEYCISTVSVEVGSEKFKVTCGLSKHFNKISEYISLPSYKRLYEVSEVMTQERETIYKDYLVITQNKKAYTYEPKKDCLANNVAILSSIESTITQETPQIANVQKISSVDARLFTAKGDALNAVLLPVISSASGNVMEFTWQYKDNFSAGQKIVKATVDVSENHYGQDVQYSDYYGRGYFEQFALVGKGYQEQEDFAQLPSIEYVQQNGVINFPEGHYLLTRKDSREALKRTYAMEFVTDESTFVIGSAIASYNPLVTSFKQGYGAKLYVLKKPINKFSKKVDISKENILAEYELDEHRFSLVEENNKTYLKCLGKQYNESKGNGQAWAIVTPKRNADTTTYEDEKGNVVEITGILGGELLIGCNVFVSKGEKIGEFAVVPTHDVYDYLKETKK